MVPSMDDGSWVKEELSNPDFSDDRLNKRFELLALELARHPSLPINQATSDWAAAKAAYRFFENPKVTPDRILASHYAHTKERVLAQNKVVVVQDTSTLDFCRHPKTSGLGMIGKTGGEDGFEPQGLIFHTTLALTEKGLPLGLIDHHIWARVKDRTSKKAIGDYAHYCLPIEKKESFKWLRGLRKTKERTGDLGVVMVADREADIFELFDEAMDDGIDLVVRLQHNRMLYDEELEYLSLKDRLALEKVKNAVEIEVPGTGKRKFRRAVLRVKYVPITLSAHGRGVRSQKNKDRQDLDLYALELFEAHPPKGVKALHWILLTTLEIRSAKDALEAVGFYKMRWSVELFFKCLKTGCKIEACRLETAQKLINYISLLSVVAWRILWMTFVARSDARMSCELVLTRHEW